VTRALGEAPGYDSLLLRTSSIGQRSGSTKLCAPKRSSWVGAATSTLVLAGQAGLESGLIG
jgi:hypothetical protein